MSSALYPDRYLVTHEVDPARQGERLDLFLKSYYTSRSREQLQRAIESGTIQIRRSPHQAPQKLRPSTQLLAGDEIQILSLRKPEPEVDFNYQILFEDDGLLVINKPAPLPVHPAGSYFFHTLLTHLKTNGFTQPLRVERDFYLAHRIDRETSGVLVLAKDKEICSQVVSQFANRETKKTYQAIIHGVPKEDTFEVGFPLGKLKGSRIQIKISELPEAEGGQSALTHFKVIERFEKFSLIECTPKTGRQHQIRVHLAGIGHPIVGDKLYSITDDEAFRFFYPKRKLTIAPIDETIEENLASAGTIRPGRSHSVPLYMPSELEAKLILKRHALHAAKLSFEHPVGHRKMTFEAPLPPDLASFLNQLRQ